MKHKQYRLKKKADGTIQPPFVDFSNMAVKEGNTIFVDDIEYFYELTDGKTSLLGQELMKYREEYGKKYSTHGEFINFLEAKHPSFLKELLLSILSRTKYQATREALDTYNEG